MPEPCECVTCCDGEHAGYCRECAGWGSSGDGDCDACGGNGICPVCNGENLPAEDYEFHLGEPKPTLS